MGANSRSEPSEAGSGGSPGGGEGGGDAAGPASPQGLGNGAGGGRRGQNEKRYRGRDATQPPSTPRPPGYTVRAPEPVRFLGQRRRGPWPREPRPLRGTRSRPAWCLTLRLCSRPAGPASRRRLPAPPPGAPARGTRGQALGPRPAPPGPGPPRPASLAPPRPGSLAPPSQALGPAPICRAAPGGGARARLGAGRGQGWASGRGRAADFAVQGPPSFPPPPPPVRCPLRAWTPRPCAAHSRC